MVGWFADSGYPGFSECKAKTTAMLLDPSSASFGAPSSAVSLDDKRLVRHRYNVSATNGFGGRIERLFVCLVDDRKAARVVSVYRPEPRWIAERPRCDR